MLGWDKARMAERADELLHLTGLDPELYRDRYPKELSGGQAQRVGVARALGADPEIMLMDEPFGAIDPITRERLQNEFLRLQAELKKTIVFVTHDIDEAIKMGDRIAILGERSRIMQCDTPERILAFPVDEFVDDFIGAGSTIKGLNFERVGDLRLGGYPSIRLGEPPEAGLRDAARQRPRVAPGPGRGEPPRPLGAGERPRPVDRVLPGARARRSGPLDADDTLFHSLEHMLQSSAGMCCVVDQRGALTGVVEMTHLRKAIRRAQVEARAPLRGPRGLRMTDQITRNAMPPSSTGGAEAPDAAAAPPPEGFFATWRRLSLGLWLAPVGIAALVGVLYVYYQNLDLANAVRQTRSALQWDTKLWPQLVQHIQISFSATAIVIAIAVPLGIVLTRPAFRRVSPYIVAVANSGQALPAYGLVVLVAAGSG